jgi:NAD(P)-dependent dehydrogenase (short-subunit alcohol dehydrogenase family)
MSPANPTDRTPPNRASEPVPAGFVGGLDGRVALVTGAGQGVGSGIARVLADQGASVIVNDLYPDRAEAVAAAVGGRAIPFDVTDLQAVRAGFAEAGPVDILVNNAGIPADGFPQVDFKDTDPALWARFVDLNLYGVMNCTHTALPGMCERGWGRVITISSEAGRVGLPIRVSLYGAAKAGAIGLMKHVAHEVGPLGVTCNALALGGMEGVAATNPKRNPIPRAGTGLDIGATAAFLASEGAEWITGQVIPVNGGAVTA